MNIPQSYSISLIIRLLAIGASSLGMLFLLPFVLKTLGEYHFGIWGMVSSITSYLLLLDFGIALACTRYLSMQSQTKEHWNEIISNSLLLSMIIGGLLLILAAILGLLIYNNLIFTEQQLLAKVIAIVTLEVALSIPLRMYLSILRTEVRYVDIGLFELIRVVLRIGGIAVALALGAGLIEIIIIAATANLIFFLLPLISSYKRHQTLFFTKKNINKKTLKELLNFSKFTAISQGAEFLKFRTDSVLVSVLLGITASAHYTIIVFIVVMVTQVLMRFMSYWDTIIIRNVGENRPKEAVQTVWKSLEIGLIISILSILNIFFYGETFIGLWVGETYNFLHTPLIILSFVLFGITFQLATAPYLNAIKKEKTNAYIDFSEVIIKLCLIFPMSYFFELNGFIIATIISATVSSIVLRTLAFTRLTGISLVQTIKSLVQILQKPLILTLFLLGCHQALNTFNPASGYTNEAYLLVVQLFTLSLFFIKPLNFMHLTSKRHQKTH